MNCVYFYKKENTQFHNYVEVGRLHFDQDMLITDILLNQKNKQECEEFFTKAKTLDLAGTVLLTTNSEIESNVMSSKQKYVQIV